LDNQKLKHKIARDKKSNKNNNNNNNNNNNKAVPVVVLERVVPLVHVVERVNEVLERPGKRSRRRKGQPLGVNREQRIAGGAVVVKLVKSSKFRSKLVPICSKFRSKLITSWSQVDSKLVPSWLQVIR
jgi:hypothetical protein